MLKPNRQRGKMKKGGSARKSKLLSVAYHEAGHAVIAVNLQYARKPRIVTIKPDANRGFLGAVMCKGYSKSFKPDIYLTPRQEIQIEHDAIVLFAGLYSEKKYMGRFNHIRAGDDYRNVVDIVSYKVDGESKAFQPYMEYLRFCAEEYVNLHWKKIKLVAKELIQNETITRKELDTIIDPPFTDDELKSLEDEYKRLTENGKKT